MVPSSGFYVRGINKSELKTQELVVGAPRFDSGPPAPKPDGLSFGSPSFATLFFKNTGLGEKFGCEREYENVPPHAQGPPNFHHSE